MRATRLIRHSLAALLIGWLTTGAVLASERWVVLGGDIAETLAALEAEINVIARDDTVVYPPAMAELPQSVTCASSPLKACCQLTPTGSWPLDTQALKRCLSS